MSSSVGVAFAIVRWPQVGGRWPRDPCAGWVCFSFPATLRGSTTPHFMLMNYFPRCRDLHRADKATILVGRQQPEGLRRVLSQPGSDRGWGWARAVGCCGSAGPH